MILVQNWPHDVAPLSWIFEPEFLRVTWRNQILRQPPFSSELSSFLAWSFLFDDLNETLWRGQPLGIRTSEAFKIQYKILRDPYFGLEDHLPTRVSQTIR